jgi:hypothetical protein
MRSLHGASALNCRWSHGRVLKRVCLAKYAIVYIAVCAYCTRAGGQKRLKSAAQLRHRHGAQFDHVLRHGVGINDPV